MHSYLLTGLRLAPSAFERLVRAIPSARLDEAMGDRFTPREVIAHMADWEPILRARLQLAVNTPGADCVAYDEVARAEEMNYRGSELAEQLEVWKRERALTVDYLASLSLEDLAKTMHHPERGVMTAEDLANTMVGHDMYHVEQLTQYL